MTLIFGMKVDLDPSLDGIEGQGRRSKVKVKVTEVKALGQSSMSKVIGLGHQD